MERRKHICQVGGGWIDECMDPKCPKSPEYKGKRVPKSRRARNGILEAISGNLGHRFKHIATYLGLQIYICEYCLETCKRGDTICTKCPGPMGID